ncbi:hypothetical protein [Cellulomonas sp. URHE0023]|uniref:hypothetical protein n=1 Tax=Cellulomonas sp. URHE0023 TaxID=1380354 RepID=UPI00048911EC|nr:hypothetical protein [Cellulomonas sp. URHE0023]
MSVVALCSAHGAPGVTTTALALTWMWPVVHPDRRVLLVDADPAGSGLLTGYLQSGVPDTSGVLALAAQRARLSVEQVIECAVAIDPDSACMTLPGLADPVQARPLAPTWAALAQASHELGGLGVDVVVDLGRLGHRSEATPLLEAADVVAVTSRCDVASFVPAAAAVRRLRAERASRTGPVALVIGHGYSPSEITTALGVTHVLPMALDVWAASRFETGGALGWRFDRSPLLRTARAVVERFAQLAPSRDLAVSS